METYFSNQPPTITKRRLARIVLWGALVSIVGIAGAAAASQSSLAATQTGAVPVGIGPLTLFEVAKQPHDQGFVLQFEWQIGLFVWIGLAYMVAALLVEVMIRFQQVRPKP